MGKNNNKSSSSSLFGVGMFAAGLIGAGIGFVASKVYNEVSKSKIKSESQSECQQQPKSEPVLTKTDIDNYDNLQELMVCPITQEIMHEPSILTPCGHTFEKRFIEDWIEKHQSCPLCKTDATSNQIKVNFQLKELIHYYEKNKHEPKNKTKGEQQSNGPERQQKPQSEDIIPQHKQEESV